MSESNEVSYFSRQDSPRERRVVRILKALQYVGMASIVGLTFLTVVHSIGRYGFDRPIPGLVELSTFMMVIAILMTIAYTQVVKGHIMIGVIVDRFSERTQAIINSFTYILCMVFAILAFWQSVVYGIYMMGAGYVSTILGIPHFPFIFIMSFGWVIFGWAIVMHLIHFLPTAVRGVKQ